MTQNTKTPKPTKQGDNEKTDSSSPSQTQTITRDGGTYQLRRMGDFTVETRIG